MILAEHWSILANHTPPSSLPPGGPANATAKSSCSRSHELLASFNLADALLYGGLEYGALEC